MIFFSSPFLGSGDELLHTYPPMNPEILIEKYYRDAPALRHILLTHSRSVAEKALAVSAMHPELHLDDTFLYEGAMLHDIGILYTDAPGIECHGTEPYIKHGLLGGKILREEGYVRHARVAERHTGTGLTALTIERQQLPLPVFDFVPESLEEEVICYADKFFSKTHLDIEMSPDVVMKKLAKFGEESVSVFENWLSLFS